MKGLVGCERTGSMRDALIALGVDAMSCDIQDTVSDGPHYKGDLFDVIDYPWDLAIFHPPCTATSVSGAKHFAAKWKDGRQAAGVSFFMNIYRRSAHISRCIFEQPVSIMSSLFKKPDQIVQPWQYALTLRDYATKTTCFWYRGDVPHLVPLYRRTEEACEALGIPVNTKPSDFIHRMPPGPERANARSATFPGIAYAAARTWSHQHDRQYRTHLDTES